MSDDVLSLDQAASEMIEKLAHEKGYASVTDYLQALVAADALVAALREDWQDADRPADEIEAGFRQAWHDSMTRRNLMTWDELVASLDDDD